MKKLFFSFIVLSICTTMTFAQRVKPTLPEPDTIRSGEYYYLWNEEAGMFVENDNSNRYYMKTSNIPSSTFQFIKIETGNYIGTYQIQQNNGWYLDSSGEALWGNGTSSTSYLHFLVNLLDDNFYTIQRNLYYDKNHFTAPLSSGEGSRIYTNVTDSTYVKWRLIPDSCALDVARMSLYLALEKIDSTFNVEPYDEIFANSTSAEELIEAAKEVETMASTTNSYKQVSWSDYKIQFLNDETYPWTIESPSYFRMPSNLSGPKTSIKAIVDVDVDDATLVYDAVWTYWNEYDRNRNELNVYIDGKLVRNVKPNQIACNYSDNYHLWDTDGRFCEKLSKGVHIVEWEYLKSNNNASYVYNIGVVKTPLTSVSLLEPGSLGTEILAQVNSVLDVRRLKIKGEMNSEDWNTISLINQLFSIDLSEAVTTEIPDNQFKDHSWLYEVALPEGLTRIGEYAFYDCYVGQINFPSTLTTIGKSAFHHSDIKALLTSHTQLNTVGTYAFCNCRYLEDVTFPKTMASIEKSAFENSRHVRTLVLPEQLESMGTYAFYECDSLRSKIIFPEGITYVPDYSFYYCDADSLMLPDDVTSIGERAFCGFSRLKHLKLSDNLKTIGSYAFASCGLPKFDFPTSLRTIKNNAFAAAKMDTLIIPEDVSIGEAAFYNCNRLKYAELPTSYYNIASKSIFTDCDSLNRIKIKSPTLLHGYTSEFVSNKGDITIVVPDYLVSSYKLDSYWYTYKDVEGFGTSEVDTWTINNPVTLGATSRFQGSPNVIINKTNLTVNGETGMELNDLNIDLETNSGSYYSNGTKYYYNNFNGSAQILSSVDITVNGKLTLDYYTYANQWAYIALPFDIRVGDIVTDAKFAVRYYDGANRAATLTNSGNWKKYGTDDIIPAGTGFVYQTSKSVWNTFVAYENANKNRALAAKDLTAPLDSNACDNSEHRGWNLVGNPWMTYFNIHAVDFTAPITVYDQYYRKYQAYSIIDDDVALHPTQAFFVQCPEDVNSITFPARGRQLTSVVTDQNGARSVSARRLVDVEISMGDATDKTRVVMNNAATLEYDYGSDAGKFFSEEEVVQLYTVGTDGTCYAINERPSDDCTVSLGFMAPTAGDYTLSLARNQAGQVVLKDLLLGTETKLTDETYTFSADAGICDNRFQLLFASIGATGVEALQVMPEVRTIDGGIQTNGFVQVYTSDGRLVGEGEGFLPLQNGFYVIRAHGESKKVVIK